jgi:hypothetical protein
MKIENNAPQGYTVAKDVKHLRNRVPTEGYGFHYINTVLPRLPAKPVEGQHDLGEGWWLLVSRSSWLDRLLRIPGA